MRSLVSGSPYFAVEKSVYSHAPLVVVVDGVDGINAVDRHTLSHFFGGARQGGLNELVGVEELGEGRPGGEGRARRRLACGCR